MAKVVPCSADYRYSEVEYSTNSVCHRFSPPPHWAYFLVALVRRNNLWNIRAESPLNFASNAIERGFWQYCWKRGKHSLSIELSITTCDGLRRPNAAPLVENQMEYCLRQRSAIHDPSLFGFHDRLIFWEPRNVRISSQNRKMFRSWRENQCNSSDSTLFYTQNCYDSQSMDVR